MITSLGYTLLTTLSVSNFPGMSISVCAPDANLSLKVVTMVTLCVYELSFTLTSTLEQSPTSAR